MVDAFRLAAAHKQFAKVGVFEHRAESIHALPENFFPMGHKKQTAGLVRMLFAEAFVVQRRNDRLAGTGGGYDQIAGIAPDLALGLQLIQDLLLVGVWRNVHGIHCGIVGVEVFFGLQRPGQPFFLVFFVILKLAVVPVVFKGRRDLVDGLRQIASGHLGVPFQTAGQRCVGEIGRTDISRGKTGVAVEDVGFCVKAGRLCVIADLDPGVGQLPQLFDGFHIGGSHVGGGDDAEFAAIFGKFAKVIDEKAQTAPLDKGYQHINAVGRSDLFFELGKQLRLMGGAGKQGALGNGASRAVQIRGGFAGGQSGIGFPQKSKKLLRAAVNAKGGKVRFLGRAFNKADDLIGQLDLGGDIPAVVQNIIQTLLDHLRQILRKHLGCFRPVDGRNRLAIFRNLRKLAVQLFIDNLFVQTGM